MKLPILTLLLSVAFLNPPLRAEPESTPARSQHHHASKKKQVKAGAKKAGHRMHHGFHKVGGHLQKFFTGKDTISD